MNVYNLLTGNAHLVALPLTFSNTNTSEVHAIIRNGNNMIRNAHERLRFLQKNKYCIDKKIFSLADVLNQVLFPFIPLIFFLKD